jgi:predicted cupin superfamily sugar epimerase
MTLDDVISALGLAPHPEGGHYAEMFRIPSPAGMRSAGTAIYYALGAGEQSNWHRIDATEIWHYYAGAPLALSLAASDHAPPTTHILGPDLAAGARPQLIVPVRHWQAARSLGAWTLVGCTVSPGFEFAGFELAAPGWTPGQ